MIEVNAHDVTERFKVFLRRLRTRAERNGIQLDLADIALRRRIHRAARRIEMARARRGDTRPFLADNY
ncbi:hypothetical protein [Azospirillum melinis]